MAQSQTVVPLEPVSAPHHTANHETDHTFLELIEFGIKTWKSALVAAITAVVAAALLSLMLFRNDVTRLTIAPKPDSNQELMAAMVDPTLWQQIANPAEIQNTNYQTVLQNLTFTIFKGKLNANLHANSQADEDIGLELKTSIDRKTGNFFLTAYGSASVSTTDARLQDHLETASQQTNIELTAYVANESAKTANVLAQQSLIWQDQSTEYAERNLKAIQSQLSLINSQNVSELNVSPYLVVAHSFQEQSEKKLALVGALLGAFLVFAGWVAVFLIFKISAEFRNFNATRPAGR